MLYCQEMKKSKERMKEIVNEAKKFAKEIVNVKNPENT
jgi:hypothetical protein